MCVKKKSSGEKKYIVARLDLPSVKLCYLQTLALPQMAPVLGSKKKAWIEC